MTLKEWLVKPWEEKMPKKIESSSPSPSPVIVPPAPTVPGASARVAVPAAPAAPDRYSPLVEAVRALLAATPKDLATAPWPNPAAYAAYVDARAAVEKKLAE